MTDIETTRETAKLIDQIEVSLAEIKHSYNGIPSNEDLETTLELLGQMGNAAEEYNKLPSNDELDETIAKLERIAELKRGEE
jgi:hypothetical protein